MPAQHVKTGAPICVCGHVDAEALTISSLKESSPNKHASTVRDEVCFNSTTTSDACGGPSLASPSLRHFNKWQLNHWWEAPSGSASRGRPASTLLSLQDPLNSPTHSDITFEGGMVPNPARDDALEAATKNMATCSKISSACAGERACDSAVEQGEPTRGCSTDAENKPEAVHSNDRTSRWTDENGKIVIQSDVFDPILPSADEVGLQWRISDLRVALRASESARLESELETEALRKYLAEVEAAAASLQSRVQELEHLRAFSKDESRELEQMRAKIVMEVSKDVRNQTARAAKAVAAAREATMELDKVKRHASSLIKSQEEEVERLRLEAAECRTLYQARAVQLQGMKDQIEQMEQDLKASSRATAEALKGSQEKVLMLQRCLETGKIEDQERTKHFTDLLEAFEIQAKALQSAEEHLKELEKEKVELKVHSDLLEQQVADLHNQGLAAADYDRELRKVRAMLGAEKQHLLMELTTLRRGNQNLQVKLVEWQEKFHTLSQRVSAPISFFPTTTKAMDGLSLSDASEIQSKVGSQEGLDNFDCTKSTTEEKVVDGQECTSPTTKDTMRSTSILCSCQKKRIKQNGANSGLNGHCSSNGKSSARKACGLQEQRARGNTHHQTSCNLLKDDLLAAAHREIVKLKEINQCLVDACHDKVWCSTSHPEKENFFQK